MSWQRATKPAHKDVRRNSILEATRALLDEPPHDPSLRAIAARAGLAASNVYRYFSSREAVLLCVLTEEMDSWLEGLEVKLRALPLDAPPLHVAQTICEETKNRERLIRLLGKRSLLLERASTAEEVAAFRVGALSSSSSRTQPTLERLYPGLDEYTYRVLQLQVMGQVSALWHLRFPSASATEAMETKTLSQARISFEDLLISGLTLTFQGAQTLSRSANL